MYTTRVQSLDHVPTVGASRVTSCDKLCIKCSSWQLMIINVLDFLFGILLLAFFIMLSKQLGSDAFSNPKVAWLSWLSGIIGALLIFCCLLSACGLTGGEGCRWCVTPSAWLGMIVGILALVMAIMIYALKDQIYEHLDTSGESYGLTASEISTIESWYKFTGVVLIMSFLVEVMRCRVSSYFRANVGRLDGEFDALLADEEKVHAQRMQENRTAREEKYDNLRDFYRQKYVAPSAAGANSGPMVSTGTKANNMM